MERHSPRIDPRRARTRRALLRAGEALLISHAIEVVSVDDIVKTAGVTRGSFYNHFEDKEALAREISRNVRLAGEAMVDAANEGISDPAERVARALAIFVHFSTVEPLRARSMVRLFAGATALPLADVNIGVLADVARGLEEGRFRGPSLQSGILLIIGIVQMSILYLLESTRPVATEAFAAELAADLLRGLGVDPTQVTAIGRRAARDVFADGARLQARLDPLD
ncbi:MAG TPA: helix-turn-helix domain-containing protein [Caulobacter sp.]|nr:helix-turn-helix domain-containing protein [Caulobacter sp.]